MMNIDFLKTVRARLLALMALIVIPVATLGVILASTSYVSVTRGIEEAQIQTASNYAVRARIWFRGMLRTVVATASVVDAAGATTETCEAAALRVVDRIEGIRAINLTIGDVKSCFAQQFAGLSRDQVEAVTVAQRARPFVRLWGGPTLAETRYDAVFLDGISHLVVFARNTDAAGRPWEATLLIDPKLLDQAFEQGTISGVDAIALMSNDRVVIARAVSEAETAWLPAQQTFTADPTRWISNSKDQRRHIYASQLVAEPDLHVLARFDDAAGTAAWAQFLVLCITPILTLALLFFTYAHAIQTNVVGWITGIERAALSRRTKSNGLALAPIDPAMPQDIRSVAEAFNSMVEDAQKREIALMETLADNRYLMRELHHRMKNSLQIIQSYLALSRRQYSGAALEHLVETEAKVQVLSTAYRLALTDTGMRPVSVRPFAEEILGNLSSSLRQARQWVKVEIETDSGLILDQIIPLGLAMVEAVMAGLRASQASAVSVRLAEMDDGKLELRVTTNGIPTETVQASKIMNGLAAQLQATAEPRVEGEIVNWRFAA